MGMRRALVTTTLGLLLTSVCHATERVEIIVDNSAAMWRAAGHDLPRFVVLREALIAFAVATDARGDGTRIGLRLVGGHRDMTEDLSCDDTRLLIPIGEVDAGVWRDTLADLFPRGRRPLVQAVRAAFDDISDGSAGGRIVIVTAGDDTCHGNLQSLLSELAESHAEITVRVVGLSMNRETADSFALVARTRNVTTTSTLLPSVEWAVLRGDRPPAYPQQLAVQVTRGGVPVSNAEISLERGVAGEEWLKTVENGSTQLRLPAGWYRGTITIPTFEPIEVAGIIHRDIEGAIQLDLRASPYVTLVVAPERPAAGDYAYIHYWDAADDPAWVTVAIAGSPLGSYLVRKPTAGRSGQLSLRMPETMRELEVRLVSEIDQGVLQLLGRRTFQCGQTKVSIDLPEKIENGTPMQISWQGPNLAGDHIIISAGDESVEGDEVCIPTGSGAPITVNSPMVPGAYEIRYVTGLGRTLSRTSIEVYEVLATLSAPTELEPGEEFMVEWTGPNGPQDYLSISVPDSQNRAYINWQPTDIGNPLPLRAPQDPGQYEIRYVRSSDGALLAREPLTVTAAEVSLSFPPVVEAGTRFEVEWSGTPGRGDFIAIIGEASNRRGYIDWSYTSLGSPLSLAAPFRPGKFEVLYVSGQNQEVVVRAPLKVKR